MTRTAVQSYASLVRSHLYGSIETKEQLVHKCIPAIILAARTIAKDFKSNKKVLLCGNGGSAADCQHLASEFVNLLSLKNNRPALPAIALTTDSSVITAAANDFGYEHIFDRQIQALGNLGDILIGLTTSGNSANILSACAVAKQCHFTTLILTGDSGKVYTDENVDIIIGVPSNNTQYIQESHITIGHILCELVEYILFGETK